MSDNITIMGNLAADPQRRLTPGGTTVTTFRVASSQRRYDKGKESWIDSGTNWYQVSAFRTLADHAFASLHKGDRVIVTGRLKLRHWETDKGKGTSVEIDADGVGHDLLWGTTQYHRSEGGADSWNVPGADASGAAGEAADEQERATASPGDALGNGVGSGHTELRSGDWGAPAETLVPDGTEVRGHGEGAAASDARRPELVDTPF